MCKHGDKVLRAVLRQQRNEQVPLMRPFDLSNKNGNNSEKAVEYARWLAKKRKIKLPPNTGGNVKFCWVKLQGFATPIPRAEYVQFGQVKIKLPHVRFDPTLPALPLDSMSRIQAFCEKQTSLKLAPKPAPHLIAAE